MKKYKTKNGLISTRRYSNVMCKGTGQYTTYNSEIGGVEYITDCEECGGTGEVNHD
jgi:DnaJ-class molecular chaperone